MAEQNILNIGAPIQFDTSLSNYEIHAHQPYESLSVANNDEIRISVQNQDLCILSCKSLLHISGRLVKENGNHTFVAAENAKLVNNGVLYLFDEIRYEINGVEIDKSKNTGITSTMKNYLSINPISNLENAGWFGKNDKIQLVDAYSYFDVCIPLQMIFGFAEDYQKIIVNSKHKIIGTDANENINCQISKVEWLVPYVRLSDKKKIEMMKFIQRDPLISKNYRSWELYEYPALPASNKHV